MNKKLNTQFKIENRRTIFSDIGTHCALSKPDDFVEITEWTNGDGVDINISDATGNRTIPMTWGEFKLIKKMMKTIYKSEHK